MADRRDNWTRAATFARVIKWLEEQPRTRAPLPTSVDSVVAERILRRLAARGLVRQEAGRWAPTAVFTRRTILKKVDH